MNTPVLPAGHLTHPVVISGSWLLRDAGDDENATDARKRWTAGFEAWFVGHTDNYPQYAVSGTVAEQLARWSKNHHAEEFKHTRRWADSDSQALAIVDSQLRYDFDGHQLTGRQRNRYNGAWTITHGLNLATNVGPLHHVIGGIGWAQVPEQLVDVIERNPAGVPL